MLSEVLPRQGGTKHLDRPVFNNVIDAINAEGANVHFRCASAFTQMRSWSAAAGIGVIVCITEGIPVQDMIKVKNTSKIFPAG